MYSLGYGFINNTFLLSMAVLADQRCAFVCYVTQCQLLRDVDEQAAVRSIKSHFLGYGRLSQVVLCEMLGIFPVISKINVWLDFIYTRYVYIYYGAVQVQGTELNE